MGMNGDLGDIQFASFMIRSIGVIHCMQSFLQIFRGKCALLFVFESAIEDRETFPALLAFAGFVECEIFRVNWRDWLNVL